MARRSTTWTSTVCWTAPTWSSSMSGTRSGAGKAAIGRARASGRSLHASCSTTPTTGRSAIGEAIRAFDLSGYDGVLAFGAALAEVYRRWGWGRARVRLARGRRYHAVPAARSRGSERQGLGVDRQLGRRRAHRRVGDLPPRSQRATADLDARYPRRALSRWKPRRMLARYGARYRGLVAERPGAPQVFSRPSGDRACATTLLRAKRCRASRPSGCSKRWPAAFPLVSAPWSDAEHLFRVGRRTSSRRDSRATP
jgi:hypothetical protein